MSQALIDNLKKHGFTEYEAKTYVAIVGLGRGTAREVCEISGVPQGRIYTVLNALTDRGFVGVEEGSPTFYLAENPADIFAAIKEEYCTSLDETIEELRHLNYEAKPPSPFWSIHSERGILSREKMLIRNAEHEIVIITKDPGPLRPLLKDLGMARKRVNLTVLAYGRNKCTGLGLRVDEMSSDLFGLFQEMKNMGLKDADWNTELFMLVDGANVLTTGHRSGKMSATVIKMPPICFMMKRLIEMLEPAVRR